MWMCAHCKYISCIPVQPHENLQNCISEFPEHSGFLYIFKVDLRGRPPQTPLCCAEHVWANKSKEVARRHSHRPLWGWLDYEGASGPSSKGIPHGSHAACTRECAREKTRDKREKNASRSTQQKPHPPLPFRFVTCDWILGWNGTVADSLNYCSECQFGGNGWHSADENYD